MRHIQTAFHEAGHAVAHAILGMRFKSVVVLDNRPGSFHVDYRPSDPPAKPHDDCSGCIESGRLSHSIRTQSDRIEFIHRDALATLAGPIAGWRRYGQRFQPSFLVGSDRMIIIMDLASTLYYQGRNIQAARNFDGVDVFWGWVREAESLVESHWRAIQAIARALMRTGRLSEDEVRAIVASVENG